MFKIKMIGRINVMKKGLTELVFIIDRSGSMEGLESDTIGGFNSMLREQQAQHFWMPSGRQYTKSAKHSTTRGRSTAPRR
jgi:hypothetical protein